MGGEYYIGKNGDNEPYLNVRTIIAIFFRDCNRPFIRRN